MGLRAEKRRQQREQAKTVKKFLRPPMYVGNKTTEEFAADLGLKKEELEMYAEMKDRELEALYQQRYKDLLDQYNAKLREGTDEYNRNLRKFEKDLKKEFGQREKAMIKAFNERFCEAENYTCLVNILLTARTLHNTWGYTKGIKKFIDTWEKARTEIEEVGVQEMLRRVNADYGLDLEFDSFDIEDFIEKCGNRDLKGVMKCIEE